MSKTKKKDRKLKAKLIHVDQADPNERYDDIYQTFQPDRIVSTKQIDPNIFTFQCENKIAMQVSILTETNFRFRYASTLR